MAVEVIYPKGLQLEPSYDFSITDPSIKILFSKESQKLLVHGCYKASFNIVHSEDTLYAAFNKFKVEIKWFKDPSYEAYYIVIHEITLPSSVYLTLGFFEEQYKIRQSCKLKYKNLEIVIKEIE
jgi:hypothetical protein